MVYTFVLIKHANIRYRDSVNRLGRLELLFMLRSLSVDCDIVCEKLGGADCLTFESRTLTEAEITYLSRHSSVALMAEKLPGGLLRPLSGPDAWYLPEDLPEILKYKGKTSVPFTRMMLNIASALTPFPGKGFPLTMMDPLCGKGTSCFCAVQAGMNAIGLDLDRKAVREAVEYFSRYLKYHQLKHTLSHHSETCAKTSVPVSTFVFADSREHFQAGDTRSLTLGCSDTSLASSLSRHHPVHLMIADLPYGIQHAPQFGSKPESFTQLLSRALPDWKKALAPGGALAVSFNTLTLPSSGVIAQLEKSGLTPCTGPLFSGFRHEVEQAVVRDIVFAMNYPLKEDKTK